MSLGENWEVNALVEKGALHCTGHTQ